MIEAGPRPRNVSVRGFGLLSWVLLLVVCGCSVPSSCALPSAGGSCKRVLFIGNSYTHVNNLPAAFAGLSKSGRHDVEIGMVANGGWTLADHVSSPQTLEKISSSKWDFVVLQEQSEIPALELLRTASMYPAARQLVARIGRDGAPPLSS